MSEKKIEKKIQDRKIKKESKKIAEDEEKCRDRDCPVHGKLRTHGRTFKGEIIKRFPRRVSIELERMVYVRKYERYIKSKTKIHARLPRCMEEKVQKGDYVKVAECRPLSKIIHFVVLEKLKEGKQK